jgi:hypothetical protein
MNLSYLTEFFLARETFNFMPIHVAGNHTVYGVITRNFTEQEARDMIIYYRCIVV